MHRVLINVFVLILIGVADNAASSPPAASHAADVIITGPTYQYTLKEDRNPSVCRHMLQVFSAKFSHFWDEPALLPATKDRDFSANSKYAFPLLPGVKPSTDSIYEMRFSAQPTSPEFSAIHWKEGIGVPGGCPAGGVCAGQVPGPLLIAHLDFDNDGTTDTVIKDGFSRGYRDVSGADEYLTVWRNQVLTIRGVADLWKLAHPKDEALTPIITAGSYLRPFTYEGRVYVARYVRDLNESDDRNAEPEPTPWTQMPHSEDMLVQQYSFTGQKEQITGRPEWTVRNVCDFEMKQLSNN